MIGRTECDNMELAQAEVRRDPIFIGFSSKKVELKVQSKRDVPPRLVRLDREQDEDPRLCEDYEHTSVDGVEKECLEDMFRAARQ